MSEIKRKRREREEKRKSKSKRKSKRKRRGERIVVRRVVKCSDETETVSVVRDLDRGREKRREREEAERMD